MKIELRALNVAWLLAGGAVLVVLLVLAGECRGFRKATGGQPPAVAPPTPREERAAVVAVPCEGAPGGVLQTLEPKEKDRRRIAETYRRPDLEAPSNVVEKTAEAGGFALPDGWLASQILGERELPELPDGGTALLTLEPDGRVEVTVATKPPRFFDLQAAWEVGGMVGRDLGGEGQDRARGWVAVEPTRAGRIFLRIEAGAELRGGETDAYLMAGAVWRNRR